MTDNSQLKDPATEAKAEMSLKEVILISLKWFRYLVSKWKIILLFGLLGGIIGFICSLYNKPVYISSSTFVLEESNGNGGGLGQYAGIASMVGIDLGGGGGGIFEGDNLPELYKSRSMILKTLLTTVNVGVKKELLIDRYIKAYNLRQRWDAVDKLKGITFQLKNGDLFNREQDSIINAIVNDINKSSLSVTKPDKKLSIIKVQVRSIDELFAKQFNDQIVKNVNDFYVQTKTKKSQQNISILQHQADSIRNSLNHAISGVALATDVNPNVNPSRQILRVPSQRRQIDVQANSAILQELVKNLEISKVSLRKETPLIQIIDEPIFPLEKERLGKIKGVGLGGIIGGMIIVIFLLARRFLKLILS
ncbi:lipopolysaccharide biosynthesis protein [Pedobacter sp. V48]|uniref:lipopolysaccharide biosynthesis protein n=1 Tax=Pedobacter sp. V48 TaxID=509635 RepID=UPI0006646909|nr:lipopolysaccharide biosynthesis protein [Pedobacter sp. V48]